MRPVTMMGTVLRGVRRKRAGLPGALAVAALALLAGWTTPAATVAQEPDCADPQTQTAMTICAGRDFMAADKVLNAAYAKAMARMKAIDAGVSPAERGAASALRDAERAWIDYRDAQCRAEGYVVHGGSMEPMVVADCKARMTRARTKELTALAKRQ